LLDPQRTLLTIARRPDAALAERAARGGAPLEQWALDVAAADAAPRLEAWLRRLPADRFERAVLINNAGVLGRVGPVENMDAATLANVLRVGLEAPALLTAAFLRVTRAWRTERRVLNVSSGAGRSAIAGWAGYCAAKAGLDHLTRVLALDEALLPNPARIVSLAPGIIDTDMQAELRASDPDAFPDLARFREFKAGGQLVAPELAARRLLEFLERPDFGAKPVADVRND
jgi:NAD(P)-dependent dehydrogenase (short-subunit alcohol dehydrogenase family)